MACNSIVTEYDWWNVLNISCGPNLKSFFPRHGTEFLLQRERVLSTLLDNIATIKVKNIEPLVNYVMTDAKQVFLTLVFSNMVGEINTLYRNGFKDQNLPVVINEDCQICEWGTNTPLDCFVGWGMLDSHQFCEKQWFFLIPVFRQDEFDYKFYQDHRLPFLPSTDDRASSGHFGEVKKLQLHTAHYEGGSKSKDYTFETPGGPCYVAVKRLKQDEQQTDIDKFYKREADTLKTMNGLKNKHLIQTIATYTQGDEKYFVFPWVDGGNLQEMMETVQIQFDGDLICWTVEQILGLCEGIVALHEKNIRHGDIKPSNILRECSNSGVFKQSILMIADVGLAKQHEDYTRFRTKTTTSRYGSIIYEPPEISPRRELKTLSRNYDIWSLGCVFLELIIWTAYGVDGIKSFHKEIKENPNSRFWEDTSSQGGEKVFRVVESWIEKLNGKLKHIAKRFLVISDEQRAGYKEVHEIVKDVRDKVQKPGYLFTSEFIKQAMSSITPYTAGLEQPLTDPSTQHSSSLYNKWRVTQNNLTKSMIDPPKRKFLYSPGHISKTCQLYHLINDLESLISGLQLNFNKLACNPSHCSLCHLLYLCRIKLNQKSGQLLSLRRDDDSHLLRSLHGGIPMVSIYSDPESRIAPPCAQSGLPCLPKCGGPLQFELLKQLIDSCDKTHDCMSITEGTAQSNYMPTRVIDVSSCLRLIETSNGIKGNYVALSHCWGNLKKEDRFCTYTHNIEILKKEIPYKSLPKSFQDAVTVTRNLGVPYLWIDSLCIIQEDQEDWESEAAKMGDVFSFAYCTIAASSAASSLDGFLRKRKSRKSRASVKIQTSEGPLYLAKAIDDFHTHVEQSKLSRRGWVLQERALSRRTIYFTSTQIYWECGNGIICETLASLRNPQSQILGDSKFPASSLKYFKDDRIRLIQHVNELYSNLLLTNATDRPKAILGLQSRLAHTFKSRASYGVYESYLERTLLWQADENNSLSLISYKDDHIIPSWSWMAYTGGIKYMDIPFQQVNWTGNLQNPFDSSSHKASCDNRLHAKANQLLLLSDETELLRRVRIDSKNNTFDCNSWKCVVVGKDKAANDNGEIVHYVLLVRSVSCAAQTYERVGVGALLAGHISPVTESICVI
ncbi:hypothetical protein J3E69DRAFT_352248 [Trichoderma sp. SZMC 28015]